MAVKVTITVTAEEFDEIRDMIYELLKMAKDEWSSLSENLELLTEPGKERRSELEDVKSKCRRLLKGPLS